METWGVSRFKYFHFSQVLINTIFIIPYGKEVEAMFTGIKFII